MERYLAIMAMLSRIIEAIDEAGFCLGLGVGEPVLFNRLLNIRKILEMIVMVQSDGDPRNLLASLANVSDFINDTMVEKVGTFGSMPEK